MPRISELSTTVQRFQYDVQQNITCPDGGRRFFDTHAVVRLFEENGLRFIPFDTSEFLSFFSFLNCWFLFFSCEIFPKVSPLSRLRCWSKSWCRWPTPTWKSSTMTWWRKCSRWDFLSVRRAETTSQRRSPVFLKETNTDLFSFAPRRRCNIAHIVYLQWMFWCLFVLFLM